jgi:hypothetical protein
MYIPDYKPPWSDMKVGERIVVPGDVTTKLFMHGKCNNARFLCKVIAGETHLRRIE